MTEIKLSIIIPSYLEEENLRILLPRLKNTLRQLVTHEIIIVDTIEPIDHTDLMCKELGITYINRTGGNSYGDGIRTGIKIAQGTHVIIMDADGSHAPEFIPSLYKYHNEFDIVIASRFVEGGNSENIYILKFMSKVLNLIYSVVLGLKCKDISNSFKLYNAKQLKQIELYSKNFDIVEEIFYKLKQNNPSLAIKEVPFLFKERVFGHTKRKLVKFIITFLVTLIRLRFQLYKKK